MNLKLGRFKMSLRRLFIQLFIVPWAKIADQMDWGAKWGELKEEPVITEIKL